MTELPDQVASALRDRYALQRELGRGGMAVVWLAYDVRHDRPVALKLLHRELAAELGPERFLREIRLTARLQHPHILPIHDSGEAAGRLWYTMPYFEGESLRARLDREKQLPLGDALRIARNVLAALAYAHAQGIIHRDIKPENILLQGGEAVLADFGIARAISAAGGEGLTRTGMAVGTPVYMSPEQGLGAHDLDSRSDVYSMGCVIYEMLAGHRPFTGSTARELLQRHTTDPVPSLTAARSEVPVALDQAVLKALAKDPADRWSGAQEFADALVAQPVAPRRRLGHAGLAVGALVLAALGLGVALTTRNASPPPSTTTRLAVLPFENLGDSADAYFADGVSDAVRGKLTTLPGLEVIARASSMAYRQSGKSPEDIARDLGVRYLVTGTVRWDKAADRASRVQVSPELVEVRETGAPASKWQQPFDAALTDVFQVQADIAGQVARALDVALGARERQHLAERPTADLAAYDAFLKGEDASRGTEIWHAPSLRRALVFYEQAVERDSTFALAWTRIAQSHALLYGASVASPAEAEAAERGLANAERLAPGAVETYRARADYEELVRGDIPRAFAAAEAGLAKAPDDAELTASAGINELRLGRIDAAITRLRRAEAVDPQSFIIAQFLGLALYYQRRWGEARHAFERALALAPSDLLTIDFHASTWLSEGDSAGARRALAEVPATVDRAEYAVYMVGSGEGWLLDRQTLDLVLTLPPSAFDDNRGDWGLAWAGIYRRRGDARLSRVYADSARIAYEELLRAAPEDPWLHMRKGQTLAHLGRKAEAVESGERAVALLPIERDALFGPQLQGQLARIYLMVGEEEKAVDRLEMLLKVPYYLSPAWLKVDPEFVGLRGNSRFQRLVGE
jgi:serine/threonine-protein kinase